MIPSNPSRFSSMPQTLCVLSSPFTNHQNWQIALHLSGDGGKPLFRLLSPFGESFETDVALIEDVDPYTAASFQKATTIEETQKVVNPYLQKWFEAPQKYRMHVEMFQGKPCVRIGNYGLAGGGNKEGDKEEGGGKNIAFVLSGGQIIGGVLLTSRGNRIGPMMIVTGVSSSLDTYMTDDATFTLSDYGKNVGYSYLGGTITLGMGSVIKGSHVTTKLASTFFNKGFSGAATALVKKVVEKKELPSKGQLLKRFLSAGVGGVIGSSLNGGLANDVVEEVADDLGGVADKALSRGVSGAVSGVLGTAASNAIEGKENILEGTGQAAVKGLLSGAMIGACEQVYRKQSRDEFKQNQGKKEQDIKTLEGKLKEQNELLEIIQSKFSDIQNWIKHVIDDISMYSWSLDDSLKTLNELQNALDWEKKRLDNIIKPFDEKNAAYQEDGYKPLITKNGKNGIEDFYLNDEEARQAFLKGETITWHRDDPRDREYFRMNSYVHRVYNEIRKPQMEEAQSKVSKQQQVIDSYRANLDRSKSEQIQREQQANGLKSQMESGAKNIEYLEGELQKLQSQRDLEAREFDRSTTTWLKGKNERMSLGTLQQYEQVKQQMEQAESKENKQPSKLTLREEPSSSLLDSKPNMQTPSLSKYHLLYDDRTQKVGDCLFDNIGGQLDDFPSSDNLRQRLVDFMRVHSAVYSST